MSYQSQSPLKKLLDSFQSKGTSPAQTPEEKLAYVKAEPRPGLTMKPEEKLAWISEKVPMLADAWRNVRKNIKGMPAEFSQMMDDAFGIDGWMMRFTTPEHYRATIGGKKWRYVSSDEIAQTQKRVAEKSPIKL